MNIKTVELTTDEELFKLNQLKVEKLDEIKYYSTKCDEAREESEKLVFLGDSVNMMELELEVLRDEVKKKKDENEKQKKEINTQKREILKFQGTRDKQEKVLDKLREDIDCDKWVDDEVIRSVLENKKKLDNLENKIQERKGELKILGKGIGEKNVILEKVEENIEKMERMNHDLVLNKKMLDNENLLANKKLEIQRIDSAELVMINDKYLKRTASDLDELKKESEGLKEEIRKSEEEVIENKEICDKELGMIEKKMKKMKKWEEWLNADFKKLYNWKERATRYVGKDIQKLPTLSKYE